MSDVVTGGSEAPFPPGLIGEIAEWVMASASYPNREIALVTAVALLSALTGRAYNTYTGAGLNLYLLLLADTGMGKETVATASSKLFAASAKSCPPIADFKGPSHFASVQGLIKWLDKKPAILCIIGEFGQKLRAMARSNSPNDVALLAGLLEVFSKSGAGCVVDPMSYSDVGKNTDSIKSPSLTIVGETVPSVFYESLDERMISNGLLPRFAVFTVTGNRPYLNSAPIQMPPHELVQKIADLASQCLALAHNNNPHVIRPNEEARAKFIEFERFTTDEINNSSSEVNKQLWNRANLKALKLASIYAIGVNYLDPVIDIAATMWATTMIVGQTRNLLGKFERDEVGEVDGDEAKQRAAMLRIVGEYYVTPIEALKSYGCSAEMHKAGVISLSYLSRRLFTLPAFKNDRAGPTAAIKRTVGRLLEDDEMREVPKLQMVQLFSCKPRAFAIANSQPFLDAMKI